MEKVRWHRNWRIWGLLLLLVAVLPIVLHRPILKGIAALPVLEEPIERSELIVVFSGGLPDIHYGVDLYHQGYGSKMLFIGDFPVALQVLSEEPFDVIERPWDEVAARLAIHAGVAPEDLLFSEAFNSSTYERVESALNVAVQNGVESVILIGSLMHSRRVKWSAERILQGGPPKVTIAPTPQPYFPKAYRFDEENWWKDERQAGIVMGECARLVYYWFRYGLWR